MGQRTLGTETNVVSHCSSLSGGELFERITAEGYTMSEAEVINYMRQICEAVKHMHEKNIIHLGKTLVTPTPLIPYYPYSVFS